MKYSKPLFVALAAALLSGCSASTPPSIYGDDVLVNNMLKMKIEMQEEQLESLNYHVAKLVAQEIPAPINVAPMLFQLFYPYNESALSVTPQLRYDILQLSKGAQRINLLGRTDGATPTESDLLVAKYRALGVRDYLVKNGVSPTVIYVNFASATDYADNNWSYTGRTNNRRVEIEIFLPKGDQR